MMINVTRYGELPIIDSEFDEFGFDAFDLPPRASDDEEAVYQRWVDIDLQRQIDAQNAIFKRVAREKAAIQASLDRFYNTMGGK